MIKPRGWYADRGSHACYAEPAVTHLDTAAQLVQTADGPDAPLRRRGPRHRQQPLVPPIEGMTRPDGRWKRGVFVYRTLDDCRNMRARARPGDSAVVLGGGLLGLEAAKALSDLGLHVTVVHAAETLMNTQLDRLGGEMLRRQIERCGIFVRTGRSIQAVLGDGLRRRQSCSTTARPCRPTCWCSPAASARGSTSRAASGIPVNKGVIVNDTLATQVPGVYAVGECAEHGGQVYGIVAPIWEQATVLADVLTGRQSAGPLPRLEALHPAQGGRDRGRLDGPDRAGAGQRRGHPGRRGPASRPTAS